MAAKKNLSELWDTIKGIEFAMLTTIDARDGMMRSRPMTTASKDLDDGCLWFFSKLSSPKMADIDDRSGVNLTFTRPCSSTFVSVSGSAEVVTDAEKIKKLWNPIMSAYFKTGTEDPDLGLFKVTIKKAEHWDVNGGTLAYLANIAAHDESAPSQAVHEKFSV